MTILAQFWTYVKIVKQTIAVQDFTFKTDSSFFNFLAESHKIKEQSTFIYDINIDSSKTVSLKIES